MNPQLTERLICPRCGPGFGLVLRADQVEEGSVIDGFLGCSNCRVLYPVARGVADLRHPPRSRTHGRARGVRPPPPDASAAETLRLAALIGVARGPASIAVAGNLAGRASGLASLLSDVEVVALAPRFDFRPPPGASHLMASRTAAAARRVAGWHRAHRVLGRTSARRRSAMPGAPGADRPYGCVSRGRAGVSQPGPRGAGERGGRAGGTPRLAADGVCFPPRLRVVFAATRTSRSPSSIPRTDVRNGLDQRSFPGLRPGQDRLP